MLFDDSLFNDKWILKMEEIRHENVDLDAPNSRKDDDYVLLVPLLLSRIYICNFQINKK